MKELSNFNQVPTSSNRAHGEALLPLREVGIFSGINITPESIMTNAKPRNLNVINIFYSDCSSTPVIPKQRIANNHTSWHSSTNANSPNDPRNKVATRHQRTYSHQ
jgi:hypothetical protein